MEAMNFGEKLIKARKKAGYTQQEVAEELKISQTVLSRYETEKLEPNLDILRKLIELYEISADWLLDTGMKK